MIERHCAGELQNLERRAIDEGDRTGRRHQHGNDDSADERHHEEKQIYARLVDPTVVADGKSVLNPAR